jgi:hypothetical protein
MLTKVLPKLYLFFMILLPSLAIFCPRKEQEKNGSLHIMSAQHAFVVQFTPDANPESGSCTGRVEHVVSGQATHFDSIEDLLRFFTQVLAEVRASTAEET